MSSTNTTINITVINGNVNDLHMNRTNAPRKATKKVESSSSSSASRSAYYIGYNLRSKK